MLSSVMCPSPHFLLLLLIKSTHNRVDLVWRIKYWKFYVLFHSLALIIYIFFQFAEIFCWWIISDEIFDFSFNIHSMYNGLYVYQWKIMKIFTKLFASSYHQAKMGTTNSKTNSFIPQRSQLKRKNHSEGIAVSPATTNNLIWYIKTFSSLIYDYNTIMKRHHHILIFFKRQLVLDSSFSMRKKLEKDEEDEHCKF